jgi:hypothetical protein
MPGRGFIQQGYLYYDTFRRMTAGQLLSYAKNRLFINYRHLNTMRRMSMRIAHANGRPTVPSGPLITPPTILWSQPSSLLLNRPRGDTNEDGSTDYLTRISDLFQPEKQPSDIVSIARSWWLDRDESEENACFQRFHLFGRMLPSHPASEELVPALFADWLSTLSLQPCSALDPMNCALRLINWISLLANDDVRNLLDSEISKRIYVAIVEQTRWLTRHIEHEVGGNHVLLQLYALSCVIAAYPNVPDAERIRKLAAHAMPRVIMEQFSNGCFHCELSTHYHLQSTLTSLAWLSTVRNLDVAVCDRLIAIMRLAKSRIDALVLPDGSLPLIGDSCYSFYTTGTSEDLALLPRLAARVFDPVDGSISQTPDCWLHGPYVVHNSSSDKLIVKVANLGLAQNPGHGHADIGSFVYCVDSTPLFVDSGTQGYHKDGEFSRIKGGACHSTLTVDGHDQALSWGRFRWAYLPRSVQYFTEKKRGGIFVWVAYEGFRQIGGIYHRRTFDLENENLSIEDHVDGAGQRDLMFTFIVHPGWQVQATDRRLLLSNHICRRSLNFEADIPLEHDISQQDIYPSYGNRAPATRICFVARASKLPIGVRFNLGPQT